VEGDANQASAVAEALAALYTAERETGFSVQTNLLTVWIAATTYFTAVLGILAFLLKTGDTAGSDMLRLRLLCALPLPACALAGYHVNLFGIGLIHSKSIELVEQELINETTATLRLEYSRKHIGSRSETEWTDFKAQTKRTIRHRIAFLSSLIAFLVPYISSLLVSYVCRSGVAALGHPGYLKGFTVFYTVVLAIIFVSGFITVFLRPDPARTRRAERAQRLGS